MEEGAAYAVAATRYELFVTLYLPGNLEWQCLVVAVYQLLFRAGNYFSPRYPRFED